MKFLADLINQGKQVAGNLYANLRKSPYGQLATRAQQVIQAPVKPITTPLMGYIREKAPIGALLTGRPQEFIPRLQTTIRGYETQMREQPVEFAAGFMPLGFAKIAKPAITKALQPLAQEARKLVGETQQALDNRINFLGKSVRGSKTWQDLQDKIFTLSKEERGAVFEDLVGLLESKGLNPSGTVGRQIKRFFDNQGKFPELLEQIKPATQATKGRISAQALKVKMPPAPKAPPGAPKVSITEPQLKVAGSEATNKAFQQLAQANPADPLVTNVDQRLFRNITDAIREKRINVEEIPWFREQGFTNDQYLEVADAFQTAASFGGQTLNRLSQTAKFITQKLPDVGKVEESLFRRSWRFINQVVNIQGAALVSNFYTAARNAIVAVGKFPMQALDDAIAGGLEVATGKATPKQAFAPLWNDFSSILRAWTPKEQQAFQELFTKYPLLKEKLYKTPIAEVALGSKLANTLTILNRFQDNFFSKIRFDALVNSEMTRRGVTRMGDLPANVLQESMKEALKFTFRGYPEAEFMRGIFHWANNPIIKLTLARFPRFMGLAMEHVFNYSPLAYSRLLSPKFVKLLSSKEPRVAFQALAKATTGTLMLGTGYAIRSSDMAGDKWYQIKVGNKVIDARNYQPLSAYLFLGEIMKNGMENITGQDLMEGALGINRISGTGLVMLDVVRSDDPEKTIKNIAARFTGQFLGGFTVPFRQFGLGLAPFIPEEGEVKATRERPILGPAIANIPFLKQTLPPLPSVTRPGPVQTEYPLPRLFAGLTMGKPTFIEKELSSVGLETRDIVPKTGEPLMDRLMSEQMGIATSNFGRIIENRPTAGYHKLNKKQKEIVLRAVMSEIRSGAKARAILKHKTEIAQDFNKQLKGKSRNDQLEILLKWQKKGLLPGIIYQEMLNQRRFAQ